MSPSIQLILFDQTVQAGFPSPAGDYLEGRIDLNEHLVQHPAATFLVWVAGDSMTGAGIFDGDLLVVDRSITATPGHIVVVAINGELTLKRLARRGCRLVLQAENDAFPDIEVSEDADTLIWGVATSQSTGWSANRLAAAPLSPSSHHVHPPVRPRGLQQFLCSCQRVLSRALNGQKIVVLSNNDGCIIARSNEAKAIGIEMGAPYFKTRGLLERNGVHVFSSNYTLFGDMSARVMSVLADAAPDIEIYSIDEAFLDVSGISNLDAFARDLRHRVRQWTGIPVCIGIGQTKTIAKLANRLAKKAPKTGGVLDLSANPAWLEAALAKVDVEDVWGIGYRWSSMLKDRGIFKAIHLRDAEDGWVRKKMGVVGLKTVMELRGVSCMPLNPSQPPKNRVASPAPSGKSSPI